MARMADFFEILKENMNSMSEVESAISNDIEALLDDLLLDPDFDTVGGSEPDLGEGLMYGGLGALPVAYH